MFHRMLLGAGLAAIATLLSPDARAEEVTCRFSAGTSGTMKYAAGRCNFAAPSMSPPLTFTIWESQNAEAYRNMALLSGRTANCQATFDNEAVSSTEPNLLVRSYRLSDCREARRR